MPRYSSRTGALSTYQVGPFERNHLYLQWGGKLPGNEQWSCGIRLIQRLTGPWGPSDETTLITGAKTAVQAMHTRTGTGIGAGALLSWVKLNEIGVDGKYTKSSTLMQAVADVAGTGPANVYPNQVALAVTLKTGFSRGPAHTGRFYLPMPSVGVLSTGLIDTTNRDAIKASLLTFYTAINALSSKYEIGVMSRKAGSPGQRTCTSFGVGLALDTQRRRRKSLLESTT